MLAGAGFNSRRHVEELIAGGRILVNGRPASLGQRVDYSDKVQVDGRPVLLESGDAQARLLIYHKPSGEIVSRDDPQGRASVFDHLPQLKSAKWIAVGRLDFNTSGLLLLTTSGDLANALMHPASLIEREYAVRVRGSLSDQQMAQLSDGVNLEDGRAKFEHIEARGGGGSNRWYHVVLNEGRNREVRRLFEAVGFAVSRLMRVRFGPIRLPPRLRPGKFLELPTMDVRTLNEATKNPEVSGGFAVPVSFLDGPAQRPRRGKLTQHRPVGSATLVPGRGNAGKNKFRRSDRPRGRAR